MKSRTQVTSEFEKACRAQADWSLLTVSERTRILAKLSGLLVEHRREIAGAIHCKSRQSFQESITSELLPLADTAKWLHQSAKRVLAPRFARTRSTPTWLGKLRSSVHRVPHGLVMVIGTWNYPLFLCGAQVLHALAAGNAVVLKPAPNCESISSKLVELLVEAGINPELIVVLDSSVDAAKQAIEIGVDHVVMTGSSASGRSVLHQLAESLTPAVMELSGCDAVILLPGSDIERVCDLLVFGLQLNGGATCLAPRRVLLPSELDSEFHRVLKERLNHDSIKNWTTLVSSSTIDFLNEAIEDAIAEGASLLTGWEPFQNQDGRSCTDGYIQCGPIVVTNAKPEMRLCTADIFAPLFMIVRVDDWSDALIQDAKCPYALTTSIFGPAEDAKQLAQHVSAGFISINDLIVPTADPQLPFGGFGESGYGVTRGDEGLISMTKTKVISERKGNWLPHASPSAPADEMLLDGLLQFTHDVRFRGRMRGLMQAIKAVMMRRKQPKE